MEKDPTRNEILSSSDSVENNPEIVESSVECYQIGDPVYVKLPLPPGHVFEGVPARIREVNIKTKKVMVDFLLFGRYNPNFLEVDFKDVTRRT